MHQRYTRAVQFAGVVERNDCGGVCVASAGQCRILRLAHEISVQPQAGFLGKDKATEAARRARPVFWEVDGDVKGNLETKQTKQLLLSLAFLFFKPINLPKHYE